MKFATTPSWCRWNHNSPPRFTIWHNLLYAFAAAFMSANLFYSHPILNVLADDFHTDQAGVSSIPTLALAGDVTGLFFVMPLADFFPRRQFVLVLTAVTMAFWTGLCITSNLSIFLALTYLSAVCTSTTQIFLPLASELSSEKRRALSISIVASGGTMGILIARILSGIIANYTSWRNVYWMAFGLQGAVLVSLWLFMPDYPATNPIGSLNIVKRYPKIMWSIVTLYPRYPDLIQTGLLAFCTFFTVASFWTTLTFLLSERPYEYSTFVIGLFGLIGASNMFFSPLFGQYIVRPLKAPLLSSVVGQVVDLIGLLIGTFVGKTNVAGPVLVALLLDAGLMITQISNRIALHDVEPMGRNRVNTAFVSMLYLGQLVGTKSGNIVYQNYAGWLASGGLSIAVIGFSLVVILVRGPHEKRWFGWNGGWGRRAKSTQQDDESPSIPVPEVAVIAPVFQEKA